MLAWLAASPAVALAAALLFLPGMVLAGAMRLPWRWTVAGAPLASVAIIALSALIAPYAHLSFSLLIVLLTTAGLSIIGALIAAIARPRYHKPAAQRVMLRSDDPAVVRALHTTLQPLSMRFAPLIAFVVAAIVLAWIITTSIGTPQTLSQSFDAAFHYNTVELMRTSGNASSLAVTTGIGPDATRHFYPAAWHAIVVLVWQLATPDLVTATNATSVAVAALVWPAAVASWARALFPRRQDLLTLAVLASAIMPQFPTSLLGFGILYPLFLGYALLPAALALVTYLLTERQSVGARVIVALMLCGAMLALGLSQPASVFAFLIYVVAIVVAKLGTLTWRRVRTGGPYRGVVAAWGAFIGVWVLCDLATWRVQMLANLRSESTWKPDMTIAGALGEALYLRTSGGAPTGLSGLALGAIIVVGWVIALRRERLRWVGLAHAAIVALYIVARVAADPLRAFVIGLWYSDPFRIAALLGATQIMLLSLGTVNALRFVAAGLAKWKPQVQARTWARVSAAALAVMMLANANLGGTNVHWMFQRKALVDDEERAFMERAARIIKPGERVANNPWDGSVMLWALTGKQTLFTHFEMRWDRERKILADRLDQADTDPEICEIARHQNVEWVLSLRGRFWPTDPRTKDYAGIDNAIESGVASVILQQGDLQLARLTACDEKDDE